MDKPSVKTPTNVGTNRTNVDGQAQYRDFIAKRVRERAQAEGFNASSFANELGISASSVANYWKGDRAWPLEQLPFVAATLGTTIAELLSSNAVASTKLPTEALSIKFGEHASADEVLAIPMLELAYGMGGTFLDSDDAGEVIEHFPANFVRMFTRAPANQLCFSHGVGDSMEPTIGDRDLLLIDRSRNAIRMNDQIWVVSANGIGMVKRVRVEPNGRIILMSDNDRVSDYAAAEDELIVIGRVIAIVRRI